MSFLIRDPQPVHMLSRCRKVCKGFPWFTITHLILYPWSSKHLHRPGSIYSGLNWSRRKVDAIILPERLFYTALMTAFSTTGEICLRRTLVMQKPSSPFINASDILALLLRRVSFRSDIRGPYWRIASAWLTPSYAYGHPTELGFHWYLSICATADVCGIPSIWVLGVYYVHPPWIVFTTSSKNSRLYFYLPKRNDCLLLLIEIVVQAANTDPETPASVIEPIHDLANVSK